MKGNKSGYLFCWEDILGTDNKPFIDCLVETLKVDWVKNAEIKKNDNGKTITVTKDKNSVELKLNEEEDKVILKTDTGETREYLLKKENGKLNIYQSGNEMPNLIEIGIYEEAYTKMRDHAYSEKDHEVGGFLYGRHHVNENKDGLIDKNNITTVIFEVVPAICISTSVHVKLDMPPDSPIWDVLQDKSQKIYRVGWYHTHPNLGIFFSGIDINNHTTFHSKPYCVGIVFDPIRSAEGFFGWRNGKIVEIDKFHVWRFKQCEVDASLQITTYK